MSNSAWILVLATIYWFIETEYFGWNIAPQSPHEVIADGIVVLLCAMSMMARQP